MSRAPRREGGAQAGAQDVITAYEETVASQRMAADPEASAWVSANAGAGKTHVLVARLIRLLLAGTSPERILCLTYTKAAAAEMATRVFQRLSRWVTMEDRRLAADIADLAGREATAEELVRARDLFASAMETPGGLKAQTIHAFCERLLQRFPLEAGVPPEFAILDDEDRARLEREARNEMLMAAVADPDGPLGKAHAAIVGWASESRYETLVREAGRRRALLEALDAEDGRDGVEAMLRAAFEVPAGVTLDDVDARLSAVLSADDVAEAARVLAGGSKRDVGYADSLAAATRARSMRERIGCLADVFLTEKGEPRASLMTKALVERHAGLNDRLLAAQARFASLIEQRLALVAIEASLALATIAADVTARYHRLKQGRAALDFDDLVRLASNLLVERAAAEWVLFKLDGGLAHVLVDEAQDTSPEQWRLVEALAQEFFSGEGAGSNTEAPRTVFAVGDEKQSIYGFQGAEPRLFAEKGHDLARLAREGGGNWRDIPLTLSFRTVAPVLDAVDRVFADIEQTGGVRPSVGVDRVKHVSNRPGMAGLVEIWPTEKPVKAETGEAWDTRAPEVEAAPAERVAERIATTIRGWIDRGERLQSEDRPIRAGDILILVRRRKPFAPAMIAALERRGIAVAGADRMVLTGQIAVQDILVLCRFLLLPEDDLSLATVLKSPLFGLDDDDLLRLAPRRTGTLWRALLAAVEAEPRYAAIAMQLKRWRARADQVPPFELLIEILDHDGMRERLLARLGTEAADGIDELVAMALAYDEDAPPSLEGFVHAVSESEHEIKRDMEHGRDQVRVLTVHGAKGLEAPIVFLPDTCADVNRGSAIVDLEGVPRQSQTPAPFVWPIAEASRLDAVKASREVRRAREVAESHRLLYVAMTRARDRLYIAGFEGARPVKGCWYELITAGLGNLEEVEGEDGRPVQRLAASQTAAPRKVEQGDATAAGQATLPEWARRRAPAEPMRLVPLAPSRLAPLETDADGDPVARPPRDGLAAAGSGTPDRVEASRDVGPLRTGDVATGDHRFLRGIVTHALLQHLPGVPPERWAATAETFVEARGAGLGARVRRGIVEDTLKLLATPEFASLFGPRSRAEVSIVADLAPPTGRGNTVRLTGQIDRLVELDGHVLVVDYKTNRPAPTRVEDVPEAYVLQLAAYRLALERIYPKRRVEAALLWTDTLHLMPIPAALLDSAAPRLFAPEVALVG